MGDKGTAIGGGRLKSSKPTENTDVERTDEIRTDLRIAGRAGRLRPVQMPTEDIEDYWPTEAELNKYTPIKVPDKLKVKDLIEKFKPIFVQPHPSEAKVTTGEMTVNDSTYRMDVDTFKNVPWDVTIHPKKDDDRVILTVPKQPPVDWTRNAMTATVGSQCGQIRAIMRFVCDMMGGTYHEDKVVMGIIVPDIKGTNEDLEWIWKNIVKRNSLYKVQSDREAKAFSERCRILYKDTGTDHPMGYGLVNIIARSTHTQMSEWHENGEEGVEETGRRGGLGATRRKTSRDDGVPSGASEGTHTTGGGSGQVEDPVDDQKGGDAGPGGAEVDL